MKNEKIKNEIKVLDILLEHHKFEQNHLTNDWLSRIALMATLGITISIALLHYNQLLLALFIFISTFFDLIKHNFELNKERKKICKRSMDLRTKMISRYKLLGVDVENLIRGFNKPVHLSE